MKNLVDKMVESFTKGEYLEFKYFLGKQNETTENRMDLLLLEKIRNNEYESDKTNADYQVKKRLKKKLEQFVMLKNLQHDYFSKIHLFIETSKYLFRKNLYTEAWDYLIKAEEMAEKEGEYQLLDQILDIQISYSYNIAVPAPEGFFVPNLLKKRSRNRMLEAMESNTNAAYGQLIYEIRERLSGKLSLDIDELKASVLQEYNVLENPDTNNLRIYCRSVNMILMILREKKDYKGVKEYGINCYNELNTQHSSNRFVQEFMFDLLEDICVASIRSKDYVAYERFINEYAAFVKVMQADTQAHTYYEFVPFIDRIDLYLCTNQLEKARATILEVPARYTRYTLSPRIYYLFRMYRMMIHFNYKEYEACIRYYQELISYNEKKILNERGFRLEVLIFTSIYGIILYYEEGDIYYADYLLQQFKRKYAGILKQPESRRENLFVKMLTAILADPSYVRSKKFLKDKERFTEMKEFIPGDWEYISLNAWLNSKATRISYYECYLQLVQN